MTSRFRHRKALHASASPVAFGYALKRWTRTLLGPVIVATVACPTPAAAQIVFDGYQNSPGSDGTRAVCVGNGNLSLDEDNDCEGGLTGDDPQPVIRGVIFGSSDPNGNTYLATNGDAYFAKHTELNGDTVINGSIAFNGSTTYNGSITASGIISTGGLTNTGGFTNNGSANVTGVLTAGSLNTGNGLISGGSAALSGTATVGSLVSNGQVSGTSLFTTGGATVQGFFNAQNGASLQGTVQLGNTQIFQGLSVSNGAPINLGNNRVQNVGTPTAGTDAANKNYVDANVAAVQNSVVTLGGRVDQQGTQIAAIQAVDAQQSQAIAQTGAKQDRQGTDVAAALGGGASYNSTSGAVSAPTYTVGTTNYNNVGAALTAANTSGLAYFHTNSTKADGSATGADAVAIGPASTAAGASAFAAGNGANASAAGAVAIGQGAAATGTNAIAIGSGATATGSVAVGVAANAANGGAAFGDRAVATGANAAALGPDASATAANAVAIGGGSVATVANTVSVGTATATRRIVNVAAGTAPSDAATVGQLAAGGASTAAALGGGSIARADGTISAPSYKFAGSTYGNVGDALQGLSGLAYDVRREARRGIAAATAMANAPMPSAPGRTSWAFNGATFHGEVAVGGSLSHRFDTPDPLAVNAGFAYAKGGNNTVKLGMSGEF